MRVEQRSTGSSSSWNLASWVFRSPAQELGLGGYPVFTRKPNTDVSYLACAKQMFEAGAELIYPQFATHNAHTIAAIHQRTIQHHAPMQVRPGDSAGRADRAEPLPSP